ncbi:AMP-binding protein [Patulibacter sp. NPDC049589]|uniref:AMP-binding protein n=1 Tax=Patulibacter sp. NPDC049589 TaxID=3154731 RepID=UPI0034175CC3
MLTQSHWRADTSVEVLETTVGGVLRRAAEEVPDRLALVDGQPDPAARRTWTYAELLAEGERTARALLRVFEPGERLAIWAANCPEWVIVQYGAALAGLTLVTVNPALRKAEVNHVLAQSEAAGIVMAREYRGFDKDAAIAAIHDELPTLREIIPLSDLEAFVAAGDDATPLPDVSPDDPAQIQYTSGTTGFPKAALLHHRGVVNASRFVAQRAGVEDGVVWVNSMPMFHIGGGALTELGAYTHRGTYVLLPGFDPALQLELVETYGGTIMLAVPTMLIAMLDHPDARTRDLSTLQTVMSGAAVVPADLVRRAKSDLGCRFTIVFGQTEMHGVISQTALTDSPEDQAETIGAPLPHAEVRVVDVGTGGTQPVGVPGEICVRGYQTMLGYHGRPEDTAAAIDPDGWLHSGDLGAMDERGYLRITGRLKDVIIRGGENVYPREVEDVLFGHPGISQVTVLGLPDAHWGEVVAAVLRPAEGAGAPDPDELRAWCRERLASFKVPSAWFAVDDLPVTPTGKVQKFVLQEQLAEGRHVPLPSRAASAAG